MVYGYHQTNFDRRMYRDRYNCVDRYGGVFSRLSPYHRTRSIEISTATPNQQKRRSSKYRFPRTINTTKTREKRRTNMYGPYQTHESRYW